MKHFVRVLNVILMGAALVILMLAVVCGIFVAHGVRLAAIQSDSMVPVLHKTDAVLIWPTRPDSLHPGEVVSVRNPSAQVLVTHRLQTITADGRLITKGDANGQPDDPTRAENLKGRVVAVFPGLGALLDEIHQPHHLLGFLYVPLFLIIVTEIQRLSSAWRTPYRYPGYGI